MMIDTFKSLRWVDFYLYALIDPRALYRQIRENNPRHFILGFTVPLMICFIFIVTLSLFGVQTDFFYNKLTYGWMLMFLVDAALIVLSAALMDLLAQILGYRGNIREMISLLNYSLFPLVLLLPLVYIFKVFHFAPVFFCIIFYLCLVAWFAVIAVQGIAEMHQISLGKAFLIFFFPPLFFGVVSILLLSLFVLMVMGLFA